MKRYVSVLLFIFLLLLLIFAAFKEKHTVYSLNDGEASELNGYQFTEAASYDGLMRKGDGRKLFDVYSLTPEFLQEKDCPT